jgi:hypothetical protein
LFTKTRSVEEIQDIGGDTMKFFIQLPASVLLIFLWPQWLHAQSLHQLIAASLESQATAVPGGCAEPEMGTKTAPCMAL